MFQKSSCSWRIFIRKNLIYWVFVMDLKNMSLIHPKKIFIFPQYSQFYAVHTKFQNLQDEW